MMSGVLLETRWAIKKHWNNKLYYTVASMCPGVDSASKNEYQDIPGGKDGRYVRVMTLPPSCAECLEILEPQPTKNPEGR